MPNSRTRFSTESFAPRDRTDAWRANCSMLWDCTSEETLLPHNLLEGSLSSQSVGAMIAVRAEYSAMRCRRDPLIIARSGLDHYLINCYENGTHTGHFDGCELVGEAGDIRIVDLTRPFVSKVERGSSACLILSREVLAPLLGGRSNAHGAVLKSGNPVVKLLRGLILTVSAPDFVATTEQGMWIEETVLRLLQCTLIAGTDIGPVVPGSAKVLRSRIEQFIDGHLFDSELGPDLLMRRFRISRTHLYRAFERDGGVSAVIRTKRLDAAYRSLLHPSARVQRISEIAYQYGFSNSTQFLRAFRKRFGLAPSKIRGFEDAPVLNRGENLVLFSAGK